MYKVLCGAKRNRTTNGIANSESHCKKRRIPSVAKAVGKVAVLVNNNNKNCQ